MKKSYLWSGLGMIAAGLGFLAAAIFWDTPLGSLFCGFCGAFVGPGLVQVVKYFKWTSPKNAPLYRERLEEEQIELRDERKEMLRNKSGRMAYILGLVLMSGSIVAFTILGRLGVVREESADLMVFFLAALLVVEFVSGILIYRRLEKQY